MDKTLKQFLSAKGGHDATTSSSSSSAAMTEAMSSDMLSQQIAAGIDTYMSSKFVPQVHALIRAELAGAMQASVEQRVLEPMREQLARDLGEKMRAVETTLKDSLGKLVRSKSVMDSLSQSLASSMHASVVNTYRDTFQKIVVPNFEKSCQLMYQQVNAAFVKGTHDYVAELGQMANNYQK